MAVRENEQRAQAIGYNTRLYKMLVFVIGVSLWGLAGALYCMYICFAIFIMCTLRFRATSS